MAKNMVIKGKDVPLGGRIEIEGKVYECVIEWKRRFCNGCDLFYRGCFGKVVCTEECRKDGQGVIFREVKQ